MKGFSDKYIYIHIKKVYLGLSIIKTNLIISNLVNNSESFQQSDLAVSFVSFIKHKFLEILLFPQRRVYCVVIILCQQPRTVIVHYHDGFDVVQRRTIGHFLFQYKVSA